MEIKKINVDEEMVSRCKKVCDNKKGDNPWYLPGLKKQATTSGGGNLTKLTYCLLLYFSNIRFVLGFN